MLLCVVFVVVECCCIEAFGRVVVCCLVSVVDASAGCVAGVFADVFLALGSVDSGVARIFFVAVFDRDKGK